MNAFARVDKQTFLRFAAANPDGHYEYERGRIVQQMTGGTREHGVIARRITRQIEDQIDPHKWWVINDRGVDTPATIRYPEIVAEPVDEPKGSLCTKRPLLIVEVLSPSTSSSDLDIKPGEYLSLPTLAAYIIASQTEAALLIYERGPDGTFPVDPREVSGASAALTFRAGGIDISLDLAGIYAGVV